MRYYNEHDGIIYGICESCAGVLKVTKWEAEKTSDGFMLEIPFKCKCGAIHSSISKAGLSAHVPDDTSPKDDLIRCPKCGSTQFHSSNQGFGLGKAAIGAVLLGPVGLLGGLIGSSKVTVTFLKCGRKFRPGQAK